MATWQYDFIAVPRDELISIYGVLPAAMTAADFQSKSFWTTRQPHDEFAQAFDNWRPEMKSWSAGLRMWGTEESNRIDVSYSADKVNHVEFRTELRALSAHYVSVMAAFARTNNCVLVSAHSLAIVEPLRHAIFLHLCRSPGVNRLLDLLIEGIEPANGAGRPSVFLSHSSRDKTFVSRLANDLKARGVPVWFDQWELKVGDSLTEKIEKGISQSGWLVVVLSKSSVDSDWVQKELRAAQARELRDKNVFVLPIVIDDCQIPLFLLDKLHADFRISYEHGLELVLRRVLEGE
jgi:hypothetical protein